MSNRPAALTGINFSRCGFCQKGLKLGSWRATMQHFHPPRAVGATSPKLISQDEPSPLRKRVAKGTSLHRSRSRIAIEFELKLAAPPEDLEKVERALLAMPIMRSERQTNVVSTYYDTPALILNREGLTLRVRKQGQSFVQTVKANDLIGKNVWERREWEEPITSSRPDLNAPKTRAHLPQAIREKELRSIFTTAVTRKVIEIEPHPSTRIEVAIDKGEIRTADGGAVEPISEIELELKDGDPAPLYDLALRLLEFAEIRLEMSSKAERGYRLAGTATLPRAVQAEPVTLDPAMAVEAALRGFAQACLNHLLNNEKAALAGEPEAIHQMRVAVRRLRSALSVMKSMLPAEDYRWASEELKWIAHSLAPARNWDIFVADLLRPVRDALPDRRDLDLLVGAAERCRRAAFDNAKHAIRSKRHTESMLRLLRWFAVCGWRDQPISENSALLLAPIVDVAPVLIKHCYRKARRRCKHFEEQTPAERHKLRIALKKVRYTIEFLGSLFDEYDVRLLVNRLKALQDYLGHANDVRVAYDLISECRDVKNHDASVIDRAGGIVLGWHERVLADREAKLRKHVRRFKQLDPFW
jgi:triphosphatase